MIDPFKALTAKAFGGQYPDPTDLPDETSMEDRAAGALAIAVEYGHIDGEHHKAWVIDRMVRYLIGPAYEEFVDRFCDGEDGPETYAWEEGIAP